MTRLLALAAAATLALLPQTPSQKPIASPAAQTANPDTDDQQETPNGAPQQTAAHPEPPLNPKLPTIFIVGDSTARTNPDFGWGDHIAPLFDTTKVNVTNRARAGRSSRSYYNEGTWARTLLAIKSGDFVLFQFGHSDGNATADQVKQDFKARLSLKGLGEDTVDVPIEMPSATGPLGGQSVETVHTYGWYMRKFFADTRARGATPILLTPAVRNIWKKEKVERDMLGFNDIDRQLAEAEKVELIDVASVEADRLQALGEEKATLLYPVDHSHTNSAGADAVAHDVADALRAAKSPVALYLK